MRESAWLVDGMDWVEDIQKMIEYMSSNYTAITTEGVIRSLNKNIPYNETDEERSERLKKEARDGEKGKTFNLGEFELLL